MTKFAGELPTAERGALYDSQGRPSKELGERVRTRLAVEAYGSDAICAPLRSPRTRMRRTSSALNTAAPVFANVEDGAKKAVVDAVTGFATARAQGMTANQVREQVIGQTEMFEEGALNEPARAAAVALIDRARSGRRTAEFLQELGERAVRSEERTDQSFGGFDLIGDVAESDPLALVIEARTVPRRRRATSLLGPVGTASAAHRAGPTERRDGAAIVLADRGGRAVRSGAAFESGAGGSLFSRRLLRDAPLAPILNEPAAQKSVGLRSVGASIRKTWLSRRAQGFRESASRKMRAPRNSRRRESASGGTTNRQRTSTEWRAPSPMPSRRKRCSVAKGAGRQAPIRPSSASGSAIARS